MARAIRGGEAAARSSLPLRTSCKTNWNRAFERPFMLDTRADDRRTIRDRGRRRSRRHRGGIDEQRRD
jgi:hypothetical protein